jgi:hypothetical protein
MNDNDPIATQDHQRYVEFCALATTGTLTDQEWKELKSHLANCVPCRKRLQEYREIARTGMAALMPDNAAAADQSDVEKSWSPETAKTELFARIARDEITRQYRLRSQGLIPAGNKTFWRRLRNTGLRLRPQYALATVLVALVAASAYRVGITRASELATERSQSSNLILKSIRTELEQLKHERAVLDEDLVTRSAELHSTSVQLQQKVVEVEKWKALEEKTAGELQQRTSQIGTLQSQQVSFSAERDAVNRKLRESQAALQAVQQRYDALREQNVAQLLRTASLENKIEDLSARLNEKTSANEEQRQFLASDRDIRELMGARDLYIADVYDVDQDGKTRKPFGRAFYTRGKSLIFYAFDLDQQPHLRNASIFQAWGRRGLNDKRPLNMGIFYLDNETNKRWVLRFDDPDALSQIDAVFVTVEPRGGSQKPSGKQLLFASLKSVPNHP